MNYWDKNEKSYQGGAPVAIGGLALDENMQQRQAIPDEVRKASSTELAAEELAAQYNRIEALVSELERRISPILRPELAGKTQTGEPPSPNGCAIAAALRQQAASVRATADRLDSIISRVDL